MSVPASIGQCRSGNPAPLYVQLQPLIRDASALDAAGNRPVRALQRLRAVPFAGEYARTLGVDAGHAGLFIERRGYLHDGRAAEFTPSYYRGDPCDLVAALNDI